MGEAVAKNKARQLAGFLHVGTTSARTVLGMVSGFFTCKYDVASIEKILSLTYCFLKEIISGMIHAIGELAGMQPPERARHQFALRMKPILGKKMKTKLNLSSVAILLAVASLSAQAAPVVLNTGLIRMGVADNGGLGGNGVGLIGPNGDAIMPGTLAEGWGASGNGSSAYVFGLAPANITSALTTTAVANGAGLSAHTVVNMSNGLILNQTYSSVSGGKLFGVNITLTNGTGSLMTDVRYARTLDWDVSPGYFDSNYTTVYGGTASGPGGKVLTTSTDPFSAPNPLLTRSQEKDLNVVNSVGDKGAFFVFGFGNLAAGESVSFDTFIGADTSVSGLLAAMGSVGVEAYTYTTGNAPGTDGYPYAPAFGYGFKGLALPPSIDVPEPSSLALMFGAVLAFGVSRRRRA